MTQLYAEIFQYFNKATLFFQQRPTIREKLNHTVHIILIQPVEDDQIQKIADQKARVLNLARLVDAELEQDTNTNVRVIRDLLISIEAPIERLVQQTNANFNAVQQDQRLEILRWLSPVPFSRHHKVHSRNRIPNIGKWLFDHIRYQEWNVASCFFLLLVYGAPGLIRILLPMVCIFPRVL